jgi:hypothetical protein
MKELILINFEFLNFPMAGACGGAGTPAGGAGPGAAEASGETPSRTMMVMRMMIMMMMVMRMMIHPNVFPSGTVCLRTWPGGLTRRDWL